MPYDLDFVEMADLKFHVKKFFLRSKSWEDHANQIPFRLNWNSVKFENANQAAVPRRKGVYAFSVKPEYAGLFETNYLFYIGKTNRTLRSRFGEYIDDSQGKNKPRQKVFTMLKMFDGYLHFNFAPLVNTSQVDLAEDQLINTFMPHVNVVAAIAKIKPEYQYLYE
ncbi:MAG TPA: GIY-YIG nuclease family protein [Mucilaginibacter sp.]|jgi:hypothetical protein|nr:GIY-YIG nuclease family protein [Mucilaginibacter sp.]